MPKPVNFRRALLTASCLAAILTACETRESSTSADTNAQATVASGAASADAIPNTVSPPQPAQVVITHGLVPQEKGKIGGDFGEFTVMPPPDAGETYAQISPNPVKLVAEERVSTFSVDVDTASYANVRRFLMNGQLPPKDAVRIEEMINYFAYDYAGPERSESRETPFAAHAAILKTPWNDDTYLLRIGIKGAAPDLGDRPPANLVFLIDVSGSMNAPDKLPLLKVAMKLMTGKLTAKDRVSIVVYAGAAGLVLEPTPGDHKDEIVAAIDSLSAGGSTAGGEGLALAYAKAKASRIAGGINRIVLATDGDFNVGVTDTDMLKSMIETERKSGTSLSVLGFGEGNINDALMEGIADIGNGNYGYVDSLKEAKRLLGDELGGTIETIAKDVKIQIEFNPAIVAEYRLIGYENRLLAREDFNNDAKDAGEIGAGHDVTALYEIALKGSRGLSVDPLRYGMPPPPAPLPADLAEFAYLKLRYKLPDGAKSILREMPLPARWLKAPNGDDDAAFAAAVAAFGQYLRGGERLGDYSLAEIAALAKSHLGRDEDGYRAEFVDLVEMTEALNTQ